MKVIVFYASFGGGHFSAASSIKQYIEANYNGAEVIAVDFLRDANRGINKISTGVYKEVSTKVPKLWGKVYNASDDGFFSKTTPTIFKQLSLSTNKLIQKFNPDYIFSTHAFSSQAIAYLKKKNKTNAKLATVITDFHSHKQWEVGHQYTDYFFVAHEQMRQSLINNGIDPNKVFVTGIPLSTKFLQNFNKEEIKKSFDLDINKKTILFFGGGQQGLATSKVLRIFENFIDSLGDQYQLIAISGKNQKVEKNFREIVMEHGQEDNVQVYGFSNEVAELMAVSDLVVTKPGGLTVSESLASGLPIFMINPIPGQEVQNTEFLEENGVGVLLEKSTATKKAISEILSSTKMLNQFKINAKLLAKRNSTRDIVETVIGKPTK